MSNTAKVETNVTSSPFRTPIFITTTLQKLNKLWGWLTTPSPSIQVESIAYRSRMFSSTLLFTAILMILLIVARRVVDSASGQFGEYNLIMGLCGSIASLTLYLLNRRGYYFFSAYTFVFYASFMLFAWMIFASLSSNYIEGIVYFYYLIIPVIAACTFVSFRVAIGVSILNLTLMIAISLLFPVRNTYYLDAIEFHFFVSIVVVVMWYYREKMEKLAYRQLGISEQRYRLITEIISDYAYSCLIDEHGNYTYEWVTESAARVTGYSKEEIKNNPALIFTSYHPEDVPIVNSDILQLSLQGGGESTGEYRLITKTGQVRWVRVHRNAIYDEQLKRVTRLYGVAEDITDNKRAEGEHLHTVLERERLGFVSQFVLAISHEFRSALASIETSRYIVQRAIDKDVDPEEFTGLMASPLQVIKQTVFRLARQLENLSAVSSLTNPQTVTAELLPVVEAVVSEYEPVAQAEGIELHLIPYNEIPNLPLNRHEIKRALRQLLENALRYTPEGGVVSMRVSHLDEFAYIEVRDSGVGISLDEQAHIFDLFYKVDTARTRNSSGVGLGLSIVKMIAEAHGGRVIVESQLDEGSSFTMVLPLARREENQRVG